MRCSTACIEERGKYYVGSTSPKNNDFSDTFHKIERECESLYSRDTIELNVQSNNEELWHGLDI